MMMRRYGAEFVGTFGIVFTPVALSATGNFAGGAPGLIPAAVVSGLAVLAMVYAFGPISAAQFNPAVTLGFAAARRFPSRFVAPYWIAQLAGATFAAACAASLFGAGHGVHIPGDPSAIARNIGTEIVLTFLLMIVIMAVATDRRVSSAVPGIAVGLTVLV